MSRFDNLPAWAQDSISSMVSDIAAARRRANAKATFILNDRTVEVVKRQGGRSLIVNAAGSAVHVRRLSSGSVILDIGPEQKEHVVMTMWAEPPSEQEKVSALTTRRAKDEQKEEPGDLVVDLWPEFSN